MRYLLCLLALAATLPACAQKNTLHKIKKPNTTQVAGPTTSEPVLVFQRTPCYGRCPAYTATIFADGRVEYDGQRFVDLLGKHTLTLPVATVNQMLAEARRIHFTELQDNYKGDITDLPATLVTVHPVGQPLKLVYAAEGIPKNLQTYINYLSARLDPLTRNKMSE